MILKSIKISTLISWPQTVVPFIICFAWSASSFALKVMKAYLIRTNWSKTCFVVKSPFLHV